MGLDPTALLDYGALGLAGLTLLLNLGLCKWVFGRAFDMMSEINSALMVLNSAISKNTKEGTNPNASDD